MVIRERVLTWVESQPGEGSTFTFAFPASATRLLSPAEENYGRLV